MSCSPENIPSTACLPRRRVTQGWSSSGHLALTRRQFKALEGALRFGRKARTRSVAHFMDEFRGTTRCWRRSDGRGLAAIAVAVLAAIVFFSRRSPPPPPTTGRGAACRSRAKCSATARPVRSLTTVPAGGFEQGSASAAGGSRFETAAACRRAGRTVRHERARGDGERVGGIRSRPSAGSTGCDNYEGEWRVNRLLAGAMPGFPQTSRTRSPACRGRTLPPTPHGCRRRPATRIGCQPRRSGNTRRGAARTSKLRGARTRRRLAAQRMC